MEIRPVSEGAKQMKRLALILAVVVLTVILGSCSSTKFFVDHDTRHDFRDYRTYAWFKLAAPPDKAKPPTEANTILTRRIRWAIDGELSNKGFQKAEVGDADFLVTYTLVLNSRMVMYAFSVHPS